jgi:protein-disulfide isomerase
MTETFEESNMKSYTDTTSSEKDLKLPLSRRHFVASALFTPLAGVAGAGLIPSIARADVMQLQENDNILGDPAAPIAIVEYASLTCPHCANFHKSAFRMLEEKYITPGKAYLVYRDFPLDRFAFEAAVLAHTAGKERFFPALKILFDKQEEWAAASDVTAALVQIGRQIGVPKAKFEENLQNEQLGESILTDRMIGANEYGVNSTPTLFINGEKYQGGIEAEALDSYLQDL